MSVRGRPLRMNETHPTMPDRSVREGLISDLRDGLPKAHACARAMLDPSTLQGWCDRGMTQVHRVLAFDAEHEGALDCEHQWQRKTCARCGTNRQTWDDLVADDERWGDHVDLLREVAKAQADVMADVIRALLAAGKPVPQAAVLDGEGEPVVVDGRVQTARIFRGDWRAMAWWLERMEPKLFHLVTRAEEADIDTEPEVIPQAVLDEVAEVAERLRDAGILDL